MNTFKYRSLLLISIYISSLFGAFLCSFLSPAAFIIDEDTSIVISGAVESAVPAAAVNINKTPIPTEVPTPAFEAAPKHTPVPTPIPTAAPEPIIYVKLTVNEGDTLERDIIPMLSAHFSHDKNDIKTILISHRPESILFAPDINNFRQWEGIIPPGDYLLSEDDTIVDFLDDALETAHMRYELVRKMDDNNNLEPWERVILASIIEWECLSNIGYEGIAAAFLNRLKTNSKLQSCVTVEYALGFQRPYLYLKDIEIDNPYNTYKFRMLPPTAISSFDDESLKWASVPPVDKTIKYFYYDYTKNIIVFNSEYKKHSSGSAAAAKIFKANWGKDPHAKVNKQDLFGPPKE